MFKTTVTYKNFFDVDTTETLRFNLTEDEVADLIDSDPTFDINFLSYMTQEKDPLKMLNVIRKIIVVSYGEVSEDGRSFKKSDEIALNFVQSAAYLAFRDQLLASDDGHEFFEFLMQILPSRFSGPLRKRIAETGSLTAVK